MAIYEKSFETSSVNYEKPQKNSVQFDEHSMQSLKIKNTASKDADETETSPNFFKTFAQILKLAKPEWWALIIGAICSIGFGFTYPAFSVIFGEFYGALAEPDDQVALDRTAVLSIVCLALGIITGLICFIQTYLFNYAGVWLTTRMRSMSFKSMMKQEIAWFDRDVNSVGSLSARLSGDAAGVQGAIGYPLSGLIQAFSNFIVGITISFYYSWKLALLCLSSCPFIVGSVIFEAKYALLYKKQLSIS